MDKQTTSLAHPALRFHDLSLRIVAPIKGTTKLYAEWDNGDEAIIDFKASIKAVKGFALLEDKNVFGQARVGSWGASVEWADDIDFGQDTLRQMAEEQGTVINRKVG